MKATNTQSLIEAVKNFKAAESEYDAYIRDTEYNNPDREEMISQLMGLIIPRGEDLADIVEEVISDEAQATLLTRAQLEH